MSSSMALANIASGAIFGSALVASGVYQPAIIIDQLTLKHSYMLGVFLTASGTSTVVLGLAKHFNLIKPAARPSPQVFGIPYGGNLLGGSLVGIGMALSGSCPGTVLVQVGIGMRTGYISLVGAMAGGIFYSTTLKPAFTGLSDSETKEQASARSTKSLDEVLGVKLLHLTVGYLVVLASVLAGLPMLGTGPPIQKTSQLIKGGIYIGFAQLLSVLVRKKPLGISTVYEDFGDYVRTFLSSSSGPASSAQSARSFPQTESTYFAAGLCLASAVIARSHRGNFGSIEQISVPTIRSLLGGFVMATGARIAGGCTSGHGISGMSTFAIGSVLTTAAMFASGIVTASFLSSV